MHREHCHKKKLKTAYKTTCEWRRMGGGNEGNRGINFI